MKPYLWRRAVLKSGLKPTTRHVLLTLACYVNEESGAAFPSTKTLAQDMGLSEKSVITHLRAAKAAGWLKVARLGAQGQGWARHEYRIALPPQEEGAEGVGAVEGEALKEAAQGTGFPAQGAEAGGTEPLKELQPKRPVNPPGKPIHKEAEAQKNEAQPELPAWLPKEAWLAYADMRNRKRKPMTEYARKLVLATLQHFHELGHDIAQVLDTSTRNCWTDVYAPRERQAAQPANAQRAYARHDRTAAAAAIFGTDAFLHGAEEMERAARAAIEVKAVEVNAAEVSHAG